MFLHSYQSITKCAEKDFRDGEVVTSTSLCCLQGLLLYFTFSVVTQKILSDTSKHSCADCQSVEWFQNACAVLWGRPYVHSEIKCAVIEACGHNTEARRKEYMFEVYCFVQAQKQCKCPIVHPRRYHSCRSLRCVAVPEASLLFAIDDARKKNCAKRTSSFEREGN